jgi:hypothetical protein
MNRTRRRRLALLLSAVCAIGALTAAMAFGAVRRGDDRTATADAGSFHLTLRPFAGGRTFSWSAGTRGDDVIAVPGGTCPKSHPRKVGTSSTSTWTQVNGGPVRHRSHRRTVCAS